MFPSIRASGRISLSGFFACRIHCLSEFAQRVDQNIVRGIRAVHQPDGEILPALLEFLYVFDCSDLKKKECVL